MNTQTLEQMKLLRFYGMHRAFSEALQAGSVQYTNDELIAHLIQSEWDDRYNRKIERLTKAASLGTKLLLKTSITILTGILIKIRYSVLLLVILLKIKKIYLSREVLVLEKAI